MKTTSNLSVDMAKFKVYDAYKSGIISEDDANEFWTFISKGEIRFWRGPFGEPFLSRETAYTGVLKQNFYSGVERLHNNLENNIFSKNERYVAATLSYANEYIKQTTSQAYRLADITVVDYDWNFVFTREMQEILQKKDFVPELKPTLAKYLEKDGEQYQELRQALIKGSTEQE